MLRKTTISLATAILLLAGNAEASSIVGATEPTQIAQMTTDIVDRGMAYVQQIKDYWIIYETLQNEIEQLTTMYTNLRKLSSKDWHGVVDKLWEVKDILNDGLAISYAASNFDTKFKELYPDYSKWEELHGKEFGTVNKHTREKHEEMAKATTDNVKNVLKATGKQFDSIVEDDEKLKELLYDSEGAEGQLQVIQATNRLVAHQTDQLKSLHASILNQTQLMSAFVTAQSQQNEDALASQKQLTNSTSRATGTSERFRFSTAGGGR